MTDRPDTRLQPRTRTEPRPQSRGDLDLSTLAIAAAASAAAAFLTSQVWPGGALWSAAASPVIVALVKEGLNRPADRLQTVRVGRPTRRGPNGSAESGPGVPDGELVTEMAPVTVYGSRASVKHRWRLAVVTGLLAFLVVAAIYTLPELVAGSSIGGGGDKRTTLFGGTPSTTQQEKQTDKAKETATPTPDASPTATPSAETTPTPTPTPSPAASATPTVTPAPTVGVAPNAGSAPSPAPTEPLAP